MESGDREHVRVQADGDHVQPDEKGGARQVGERGAQVATRAEREAVRHERAPGRHQHERHPDGQHAPRDGAPRREIVVEGHGHRRAEDLEERKE
jgi:hypothetical protein